MRVQVAESVEIGRPIEQVFAYVANVNHLPDWAGTTIEVRGAPRRPLQDNETFTDVGLFLGRRIESSFRVRVDAPRQLVFQVISGPLPYHWTYLFAHTAEGTRVTLGLSGDPGGFFRLATPLVTLALKRQLRRDLAALKAVLERAE